MTLHQLSTDTLPAVNQRFYLVHSAHNLAIARAFTAKRYADVYDASLTSFLPQQICYLGAGGAILAAAGYQSAEQPLFLEQYLERPVEEVIAEKLKIEPPERTEIVEIGNFAAISAGATRQFILHLGDFLLKHRFHWLVITATPLIRSGFEKSGVSDAMHTLADACPDALSDMNSDWGTYYDHGPQVVLIDIKSGRELLYQNPLAARMLDKAQMPVDDSGLTLELSAEKIDV